LKYLSNVVSSGGSGVTAGLGSCVGDANCSDNVGDGDSDTSTGAADGSSSGLTYLPQPSTGQKMFISMK
jgi:hypothetical protein